MNLNSYILEQALRRLHLSEDSIRQFQLAGKFSDVDGGGFPKELFQLSTPVILRGLLNFAVLQMQRDWVYPYWVHRQLDPEDASYIPRAQNPLLINVTHRNWTTVGTLNGYHEAIVDPRGLATPLPREWSIDTWVLTDSRPFFPSLSPVVDQQIEAGFPGLTTRFGIDGLELTLEHFASPTNHGIDILFAKAAVRNLSASKKTGALCVAVRPFNPEGVAPVLAVEFRTPRILHVNNSPGIAFSETPDHVQCSSLEGGDIASALRKNGLAALEKGPRNSSSCPNGLAHAAAFFLFDLAPGEEKQIHYSSALADEKRILRRGTKQTWRVAFEKRRSDQQAKWAKELAGGSQFEFADRGLQQLFDASRLALLQLHDGPFISPGPFLYHHFWYRDATLMVRALDLLGFHQRSKEVIDAFPKRLMPDGFFRGPAGEWDSNGAVIWSVHQHFLLTRQHLWLRNWYPQLKRAAKWIIRKKTQSANGLMPASLSAEHLGTVDQYYWDSFWSLAGLRSMAETAQALNLSADAKMFRQECDTLRAALVQSFERAAVRLGAAVIPATERRGFDESAIGSVSSLYPLELFDRLLPFPQKTLCEITSRFVDGKGFLHPFVHSGYNPYLTLQIAHSFLLLGEVSKAWEVAETIFRQARPPFSFPEAIHPHSGGGVMGDGHHGWAAAEIILFLRDCLVREEGESLSLFKGSAGRLIRRGTDVKLQHIPTRFGAVSCSLTFTDELNATFDFEGSFRAESLPGEISITLPFAVKSVAASSPNQVEVKSGEESSTLLRCSPNMRTLFLKL